MCCGAVGRLGVKETKSGQEQVERTDDLVKGVCVSEHRVSVV